MVENNYYNTDKNNDNKEGKSKINRILKFRAWEESQKRMYKCIVGNNDNLDDEFICPLVWVEEKMEWLHSDTCKIMQYTGYKDVRGKEIYEGDILAYLEHQDYWWVRIEYYNGSFMIRDADKIRYNNKIYEKHISDINISKWRIIGNIYENKGLL